MIQPVLARFNASGQSVDLNSQELGYLTLTLVDGEHHTVNPTQIYFVPDGKLSINLIMEFKRLNRSMRLVLGSTGTLRLKIVYEADTEQSGFLLEDEASTLSVRIGYGQREGILRLLDDLSIVVASNTFYQMDLGEVGQQAVRSGRSVRNTVANTVAGWLLASTRPKTSSDK